MTTEDHSTRKIAVEDAAAAHFSPAEPAAQHAKSKAEAAQAGAAPASRAAPDSSKIAYAFGAVLGRKLKALFKK